MSLRGVVLGAASFSLFLGGLSGCESPNRSESLEIDNLPILVEMTTGSGDENMLSYIETYIKDPFTLASFIRHNNPTGEDYQKTVSELLVADSELDEMQKRRGLVYRSVLRLSFDSRKAREFEEWGNQLNAGRERIKEHESLYKDYEGRGQIGSATGEKYWIGREKKSIRDIRYKIICSRQGYECWMRLEDLMNKETKLIIRRDNLMIREEFIRDYLGISVESEEQED